MGKARSYEIIEYRKAIMNRICTDPEIVRLLGCEGESDPQDAIPYRYSYPHEYIPPVVTKTDRFINFEVSARLDYRNNVYKDLDVYFYVVCHEDAVRYVEGGVEYLWYDKATCALDNLFGGHSILGIGRAFLESNVPYCPKYEFKGRLLRFAVTDFYNGLRYGK